MPPELVFWVSDMHHLAAKCSLPGDTNWPAQFLLICGIFVMGEAWDRFWLYECHWYAELWYEKL